MVLVDEQDDDLKVADVPILGTIDHLPEIIKRERVQEVIFSTDKLPYDKMIQCDRSFSKVQDACPEIVLVVFVFSFFGPFAKNAGLSMKVMEGTDLLLSILLIFSIRPYSSLLSKNLTLSSSVMWLM